ncbi:MAG TPA: 30S ribosomal protein S4 [Anaerolineaceae bacterium]|jgi:small subunit ribosomal protein S4|nr:MAG: 30S ribosomal protein S4 [Anaerolineaceae bacterium 46_22]HAF47822.1 30S ribosomal protein S4 [Anaerolineaceae bacterium]
MARYTGPACKLCRREGEKLFLKGERCFTPKCSFEKRAYPPGEHGRFSGRRGRESDYQRQLRAKQKAKRIYGVLERQFRRYFRHAQSKPGLTGLNLLQVLESRLDNVVYRSGFAESRSQARQLVNHGHFMVNGRNNDIASTILKPGDTVLVRENSKQNTYFKTLRQSEETRTPPAWVDSDLDKLTGRVIRLPERAEIDGNLNEQLIVEYYSR